MPDLYTFDPSVFDALPKAQRAKFMELVQKNHIFEGKPFFLDDESLPVPFLDGFCDYLVKPKRKSPNTWKNYASHVSVFLRFLKAQGKAWNEVEKYDLDTYYRVRTNTEFQSSAAIKDQSWNVAATAIVHLYEYANESGLIYNVPFNYVKKRSWLGGTSQESADIRAKATPEPINFIKIENYLTIWRPALLATRNSQRNLALTDLLVVTGLRISEALALKMHQLPDPDDQRYKGLRSVTVKVVGKGRKSRSVRIPKWSVKAIRFYIDEGREEALANSRKNGTSKNALPKEIFLSKNGKPLRPRAVQDLFASISQVVALTLTPHGCRHTFAVYQLDAMVKRMAKNLVKIKEQGADAFRQIMNDPLRELQNMLGHSYITTTFIYLKFLEDAEAMVDDSLAAWTSWESGLE